MYWKDRESPRASSYKSIWASWRDSRKSKEKVRSSLTPLRNPSYTLGQSSAKLQAPGIWGLYLGWIRKSPTRREWHPMADQLQAAVPVSLFFRLLRPDRDGKSKTEWFALDLASFWYSRCLSRRRSGISMESVPLAFDKVPEEKCNSRRYSFGCNRLLTYATYQQ